MEPTSATSAARSRHQDQLHMSAVMQQHHVAFWTAGDDKVQGVGSYGEMALKFDVADRRYAATMAGQSREPALTEDFRTYIAASQRPDFSDYQRKSGAARASQLLRLRYYGDVSAKFAAEHRKEIASGYAALGLRVPDFGRLDRAAAHVEIERFVKAAFVADKPATNQLSTLLEAFDNLDGKVLPEAWCQHEHGRSR